MSGGGTKTQTENVNQTQKVTLPAWMSKGGETLYNKTLADSAGSPAAPYTGGPMTAGMDPNQAAAGTQAAANSNAGQADLTAARSHTGAAAAGTGGRVAAGNFDGAAASQYMSPYLQDVQQRTVDEMRRQNAIQMQGQGDAAGAAHAFGGTRQGVQEAEMAKGQGSNMLDYLARSNQAGYENAQGQFNADRDARMSAQGTNAGLDQSELDRKLQAGSQYGGLSQVASGVNTENIRNLLLTGQAGQDTANAADAAQYNEFLRNQDAGVKRDSDIMSILAGTPHDMTQKTTGTNTTTQKQSGGLLNTIMGMAQIAASAAPAFSDPRLKTDAVPVGRHSSGLPLYAYRYRRDRLGGTLPRGRQVGVMSSDVALFAPWALGPMVEGYATVDYSKLGGVQ